MKIFTYVKDNSSRIKKKNFQLIGRTPLWKMLLYELNHIGCQIYVDTDSKKVLKESKRDNNLSNLISYERKQKFIDMEEDPNNLLSPALLMLEDFLNDYVEDEDETIVLTHVTSPFLSKETVLDAVKLYEEGQYDFIHSVNKEKDFAFLETFENPINFNPQVIQRTQDLPAIYFSNGAFFIFNKKVFMREKNRWGKNILFYPLDTVEGIEIDYEEDLRLAKFVFRGMGIKNELN